MTREELKHRLSQYRALRAEFLQVEEELKRLENLRGYPAGSPADSQPRAPGVGDPAANTAIKHMEICDRYMTLLRDLAAEIEFIEKVIEPLEPQLRYFMRCRYINGMTWECVCDAVHYSYRHIYNLHEKALDLIVDSLE